MVESMNNINFEEILRRKLEYIRKDNTFEYEECERLGEIQACTEMIADTSILCEEAFIKKYCIVIKELSDMFESRSVDDDKEIARLSYYNNIIVWALQLLNPKYLYDTSYQDSPFD